MATKKNPFTVRSAYGKKKRYGDIGDLGESLTKQSFTEECNINNIMQKYQKTGAIDHVNKHEASYGFATSLDFQSALETVARGRTMFDELPSSIRSKFDNDPGKFLDFVQDEKNITEMQELGLSNKNQIKKEDTIPAKQGEAQIPEGDDKKPATSPEPESK